MHDALKPTHKVSFYGVRCYWDCHTGDLWGCNWFWELLVPVVAELHNLGATIYPPAGEHGFPLYILEEF